MPARSSAPLGLLRPCRCAAKPRDELPPSHPSLPKGRARLTPFQPSASSPIDYHGGSAVSISSRANGALGEHPQGNPLTLFAPHQRIIVERLNAADAARALRSPPEGNPVPIAARPSDPITPRKAVGTTHHPIRTRPGPPGARGLACRQRHGNRSRCNRCSRRRGRLNRHMGPDILGLIAPVPSRVISAGSGGFASPCRASAARLRSCARCLVPASRRLGWQRITLAISKR